MTMEKNPDAVARLAGDLEDENWRFRSYLKMVRSPARIDLLAEQFGREAAAQMDCTACGACCRDNCVPVTDEERRRLAARSGLSEAEFERLHMTQDDDGQAAIDARPCLFLQGTVCAVYEDRPEPCRGYPYIGGHLASRMIGILERAAVCPIVFEMLDQLKRATGFKRYA